MDAVTLSVALGPYRHVAALREGRVRDAALALDFADISPISRAFAPMVRESRFDVSEMAIATFLQARAAGRPLVLLPVVMAARFQQAALLCLKTSAIASPADLAGKRIAVRAYSQTTGMWLRGILQDEYGIGPERIDWITFEGAHESAFRDPPWCRRAAPGKELMAMLRAGEADAVIVGNDMPEGADLRTVFPDPGAAATAFLARHGFVPVNHMVTIRREIAAARPDLVLALLRLFRAADAAPDASRPFGVAALRPAVTAALRHCTAQGLLSHPLAFEDVWNGLPEAARELT